MNVGDLVTAWPLVLADGTELADVLPAEAVRVLELTDGDGNTYVQGMESKQKQWIATTSLIETGKTWRDVTP